MANSLQVSLSDIFYDLYLDFCPSQSNEDLESPNYSDDDSDDPEVDDVDEQVTKIMRDPPIKLVAMQPPPSISMICDTRPVYRLKSSQILGFKNLFLPSSYLITC